MQGSAVNDSKATEKRTSLDEKHLQLFLVMLKCPLMDIGTETFGHNVKVHSKYQYAKFEHLTDETGTQPLNGQLSQSIM